MVLLLLLNIVVLLLLNHGAATADAAALVPSKLLKGSIKGCAFLEPILQRNVAAQGEKATTTRSTFAPSNPKRSFDQRCISLQLFSSSSGSNSNEENDTSPENNNSGLDEELDRLQNQLALIEALEERNKAQLESFIDEQDQWDSMEDEDRHFLQQKDEIVQRMEILAEEMVQMWMGAKSMDG